MAKKSYIGILGTGASLAALAYSRGKSKNIDKKVSKHQQHKANKLNKMECKFECPYCKQEKRKHGR